MIIVIGLVMGAIFISFIFFDMFTVFMNKRVSQTSADAAVLGAVQEIKTVYEESLTEQLKTEMEELEEKVEERLEEILAIIGDDEGDDEESNEDPPYDTDDKDELIKLILEDMDVPEELHCYFESPRCQLNANAALAYFFEDIGTTSRVCQAIGSNWSRVEQAAQYYATKNGAQDEVELIFPYRDQFAIYAAVYTEASFVTVDDASFGAGARNVEAAAAANIVFPEGLTFVLGSCR
ncbi:hypothetical protein [Bacillus horti]|uniref:Flp pilus-assembly TadG-like N-terminal domain-containing protein n=1 Tax=Caldalkalibacillus horti TaxID=77523 RepID=A0ABT9VW40_9BACI|nr:hypothetical protein [Bacillus horti]MDQ0165217.1 hypothetical protein [Bacillus horti]